MFIQLKKEPDKDWERIEAAEGLRIEDLYKTYQKELPYTVLCAKQNNLIEDLNHLVKEGDKIEFIDGSSIVVESNNGAAYGIFDLSIHPVLNLPKSG